MDRGGEPDQPDRDTQEPALHGARADVDRRGYAAQAEEHGGQDARPGASAHVLPGHPQPDQALERSGETCSQHLPGVGFNYGAQVPDVQYSDAGRKDHDHYRI